MPNDEKFAGIEGAFDEAGWRKRFAEMPDRKLIEYGKACRRQANPKLSAPDGKTRNIDAEKQLALCIEEWRRRHPRAEQNNS
jgi:hypothetical protein